MYYKWQEWFDAGSGELWLLSKNKTHFLKPFGLDQAFKDLFPLLHATFCCSTTSVLFVSIGLCCYTVRY